MANAEVETEVITTADGMPLKQALKKALWERKKTALLLVAPLFIFVLITFLPLLLKPFNYDQRRIT